MANLTENTINEIIKSHVYGMTEKEICEIYDVSAEDVRNIICEKHDDIEAEKVYRSMLARGR